MHTCNSPHSCSEVELPSQLAQCLQLQPRYPVSNQMGNEVFSFPHAHGTKAPIVTQKCMHVGIHMNKRQLCILLHIYSTIYSTIQLYQNLSTGYLMSLDCWIFGFFAYRSLHEYIFSQVLGDCLGIAMLDRITIFI